MWLVLTILLLFGQLCNSDTPLKLYLFSQETVETNGTRCLDGSPSGFYFRPSPSPPSSPESTSWVIFLQGGGVCVEPIDCYERSTKGLGSSKYWEAEYYDNTGLLSSNSSLSRFANFNHVWIRYCTGDVHIGMQKTKNFMGFYFAGNFQLMSTLDYLDNHNFSSLPSATEILLAGGSAGAIPLFSYGNLFQERYPNARVRVAAQAGYFFAKGVVAYPEWKLGISIPFPPIATSYLGDMYSPVYIEPKCRASHSNEPYLCISAPYALEFLEVPIFIANNIFDSVQLEALAWIIDDKPFLEYFGKTILNSLQDFNQTSKNGMWMPSCLQHTGNICLASKTLVNGISYKNALENWYFSETNSTSNFLVDSCYYENNGFPCNSVCSGPCDPE